MKEPISDNRFWLSFWGFVAVLVAAMIMVGHASSARNDELKNNCLERHTPAECKAFFDYKKCTDG